VLEEAETILQFLLALSGLKRIPRSGWLSHGVSLPDVESVAEHTFSTSALSMILADLEERRGVRVDIEKVLRMTVLHDLAESFTFDISQAYLQHMGKRGRSIKREVEKNAWEHLAKGITDRKLAGKYKSLQSEYDSSNTKESKIVHAADSLDILLQIVDYKRRGYPAALFSDLWNERRKMVARAGVPSARRLLKIIVHENLRVP
jgi:putative hydrolase of HD superfamily